MASTIKNALTVDVEDYFHVAALAESIDRGSWDSIPTRVQRNTDTLLELFDEASTKATFFVLAWVAEKHPQIVRAICDAGHELACHGYSHELIYRQTPAVFSAETQKAKSILEDLSGVAVNGYRAASYSITKQSIWALDILVEAGFSYDSSIVPVYHDLYGLIDAKDIPHRLVLRDGRSIDEFPPSTISILGHTIPIGGGGYFRIFPYWFSHWGLSQINRKRQIPFAFYLHPWEIDPDQPRVKTSLKSRFRHYTNLHKCQKRLVRLLSQFQFGTMRSVLANVDLESVAVDDISGSAPVMESSSQ